MPSLLSSGEALINIKMNIDKITNKRKKSKKAQIFTVMTIAIIALFFISYEIYSILKTSSNLKDRVLSIDSFVFSLEQDLNRKLYAFGFRTIFLAEDYITQTGQYISNFSELTQEAFFNGTINNQESQILQGVYYEDLLQTINQKSNKINANVNITNTQIQVYQTSPWKVTFEFSFNLLVEDKSNLAKWNKQENIITNIPITGFEDPLYTINTNSLITNTINQTTYTLPTSNTNTLLNHTKQGLYISSTQAPNFIQRLEGDLTANTNGITSLVYIPSLTQQGITSKTKSIQDYIYFSTENPSYSAVTGMPSWFYLDDDSVSGYVS